MIRKRMISPEIWGDPSFNKLSIPSRLLFIGMISNADDDGYLRGDSKNLKRIVFGNDDFTSKDVQDLIGDLRKYRNVHFYKTKGEEFVHLVNWEKYQRQQRDRRSPSVYPMCSRCVADVKQMRSNGVATAKQALTEVSSVSKLSKKEGDFFKKTEFGIPEYKPKSLNL